MSLKINKRDLTWMVVCLLSFTALFVCWLWTAFNEQQIGLSSESDVIFKQVVQNEKKLCISRRFGSYDSKYSPNDIPKEEKSEWCAQDYLTYCDPDRSILDSLFRVSLIEKGIKAQAAVRYVCNGYTIDTCPDSLFYKTAFALEPIVYRKDTNKDNNITLQAYVKFPFKTVLTRSPLLILIFCLWLILFVGIIGVYYYIENRRKKVAAAVTIRESIVPLVQEQTIIWTKLASDLLFDEKCGDLQYKDCISVRLGDNLLRLFRCFIKAEQYKLTYENICTDVLGRPIKEGVTKSDREAVAGTIYRLRDILKTIPVINIKSIRSAGYQIEFLSENIHETDISL